MHKWYVSVRVVCAASQLAEVMVWIMMLLFLPSGLVDAHSVLLFLKHTREHCGYLTICVCKLLLCFSSLHQFDLGICCMMMQWICFTSFFYSFSSFFLTFLSSAPINANTSNNLDYKALCYFKFTFCAKSVQHEHTHISVDCAVLQQTLQVVWWRHKSSNMMISISVVGKFQQRSKGFSSIAKKTLNKRILKKIILLWDFVQINRYRYLCCLVSNWLHWSPGFHTDC